MSKQTNYMTYLTTAWLVNKCYGRDGKLLKPSYKDTIYKMATVDELKAFVWEHTKPHVNNLEAFKKGQKGVNYQAILDVIKEDKGALI